MQRHISDKNQDVATFLFPSINHDLSNTFIAIICLTLISNLFVHKAT